MIFVGLKSVLSEIMTATPASPPTLVNIPPFLYFEPMCVLAYEMDLDTVYGWVLTFYSICLSVSLIGAFSPFKFRINIDIFEFNIVV